MAVNNWAFDQRSGSPPSAVWSGCGGTRKLKCVAALDLVPAQSEAHTSWVIKIIFVACNTIVLPISREQHLLKVFASFELFECDRERTSLLAFVGGDADLFLTARNLVEQSKFAEKRLCVHGDIPGERKEFSVNTPRRRIAAIHNEIRKLIKPCERVSLIGCGVLPLDSLSRLLADYQAHPYAGFIEGVEPGRWEYRRSVLGELMT